MRTIDLRDNSKDALGDVCDDANEQTTLEAERPETFNHGAEQTSNSSIKVRTPPTALGFLSKYLSAEFLVLHPQICSL